MGAKPLPGFPLRVRNKSGSHGSGFLATFFRAEMGEVFLRAHSTLREGRTVSISLVKICMSLKELFEWVLDDLRVKDEAARVQITYGAYNSRQVRGVSRS